MKQNKQLAKKEQGQGFVELALVLPILLIMVVGIYDVSWGMLTYSVMKNAAEEGATYASFYPKNSVGIENRVRNNAKKSPINMKDNKKVKVSIKNVSNTKKYCAGEFMEVSVQAKYTVVTPFVGAIFGSQEIELESKYVSTILTPDCK